MPVELLLLYGGASKEIDMVGTRQQGDQAKQEPANDRDPALEIKADKQRSEKERLHFVSTPVLTCKRLDPWRIGTAPGVPLAHTRCGVQKARKGAIVVRTLESSTGGHDSKDVQTGWIGA